MEKLMLAFAVLLLLVSPVRILAQIKSTLQPESVAKIEALVQASMSESKTPGMSVAIAKDRQSRY